MVKNLSTVERSTKIRFGRNTLDNQAENTIVFNASDTELQATRPGAVYLSPIRFREDFSDPGVVLLMYDKATGEITESGSSASDAMQPPLELVTGYGNTTPHTVEFKNENTSLTTSGNVHVSGDLNIEGNLSCSNGTITEIKNVDLVVKDRIIGIAHNNIQTGLDTGIIINYPNQNIGIIHHGDENPKRLSIGYTQNGSTDVSITADSANKITLDVLGDLKVQNNVVISANTTTDNLTTINDVTGVNGTFTGTVTAGSITDGIATLSGGAYSGSAAELTTTRKIGGVDFNGSADIDLPGVNTTGTESTTGSAATLTTTRKIGNVDFNGSANIDLPGVNIGGNQDTTGSAATLTTTRKIGNVDFNGSADIDLPGVNVIGNQNTTGSAATLTTTRKIGNVDFNGSADIDLPGVNVIGNQNTTGSAAELTTARQIGGVWFDGSEDIVPTTFNDISANNGTFSVNVTGVDGIFSGDVSGVAGTFSGAVQGASYSGGAISGTTGTFTSTLSSAGFTATGAQINGILNTTGNLSINNDTLYVDATNERVGVGTSTPAVNRQLDVVGNVYASGLITGDGGGLSNIQVSSIASDIVLGTDTSGSYVASLVGGDGITAGAGGESSTPTVAVDIKTNGGLVIESGKIAIDLAASSITNTLAVADGGTGVTASTGSTSVVLSDSPTLTGTLTTDLISSGAITGTAITVTDTTLSTSTSTGSVIISGGMGIAGNIHSSNIFAAYNQDVTSFLGRAAVGHMGESDHASFAHIDHNTTSNYALKQSAVGVTHINAKDGQNVSFKINNDEKARLTTDGDFYVDTDTLYVDAVNDRVGVGTATPSVNRELDVVGNVYASKNITAAGNLTVENGLIINSGSVTKKFYSYEGTISHLTAVNDANVCLTFTSNIFHARVIAHLVEDETEFSNMSLEVGGGSRSGGTTPNLKLGSVSVFGNTSTNPWNSTVDVSSNPGSLEIKPSTQINSGGGSSTASAIYNIFIEYISSDNVNGKLSSISLNGTTVKTFDY